MIHTRHQIYKGCTATCTLLLSCLLFVSIYVADPTYCFSPCSNTNETCVKAHGHRLLVAVPTVTGVGRLPILSVSPGTGHTVCDYRWMHTQDAIWLGVLEDDVDQGGQNEITTAIDPYTVAAWARDIPWIATRASNATLLVSHSAGAMVLLKALSGRKVLHNFPTMSLFLAPWGMHPFMFKTLHIPYVILASNEDCVQPLQFLQWYLELIPETTFGISYVLRNAVHAAWADPMITTSAYTNPRWCESWTPFLAQSKQLQETRRLILSLLETLTHQPKMHQESITTNETPQGTLERMTRNSTLISTSCDCCRPTTWQKGAHTNDYLCRFGRGATYLGATVSE